MWKTVIVHLIFICTDQYMAVFTGKYSSGTSKKIKSLVFAGDNLYAGSKSGSSRIASSVDQQAKQWMLTVTPDAIRITF